MTSSLPAVPSIPTQDLVPQPVRRTYGRARQISPFAEYAGPSVSLFRPTENVETRPTRFGLSEASPAKSLLNRFSAASTSWHDSLALLDAENGEDDPPISPQPQAKRGGLFDFTRHDEVETEDGDGGDEEDLEATKAAMERMRREARGEAPKTVNLPPAPGHTALKVPVALGPTTSSSSLSDAPPSSSPSGRERLARMIDEETMPVRKPSTAGPSGRVKRVIMSDEEESEDEAPLHRASVPEVDEESDDDHIPDLAEALEREAAPESSAPAPSRLDTFLRSLEEDDDDDPAPNVIHSPPGGDPVGLFDDDEPTSRKSGALKPLNKQDQKLMRQDIARAQREREPRRSRPVPTFMPMSTYLEGLREVVVPKIPGLTRGSSPRTSPSHTTPPDDIVSFTPSSNDHIRSRAKSSVIQSKSTATRGVHSSPTPLAHKSIQPGDSDGVPGTSDGVDYDDDERIPDLGEALDLDKARRAKEAELKAKHEQLKRQKLAALQAKTAQKASPEEEDDFEILPADRTPKPRARFLSTGSPDAKAVLKKSNKSPALSKARQDYLRRAGVSSRPKGDVTETYMEVAAKTYNHAGQRKANGGARPVGQKIGRDRPLSTTQMNAKMQEASRVQAAQVRQKKEEGWGKVRVLPEKRQLDMQAVIQASVRDAPHEEEEEDEDEEDEDFVPDGDEFEPDVEMDEVENGSATPEDQDMDEVHGSESGESQETDKENLPAPTEHETSGPADEDDEDAPIVRRRPRGSARVAVDSDDEGETRPRAPLQEIVQAQTTPSAPVFDLGGFGDGSPGFSQLFEATQLNTAASKDGLANLREADQPAYLAVNALLPGVDITETQIERDNAVIAAELEAALPEPSLAHDRPRYLNDQGFFTQTKPLAPTHPQTLLRRTSTSLGDIQITEEDEGAEERTPSTTEKGSSVPLTDPDSPTQTTQTLTRLRRRGSSPEVPLQNTFGGPTQSTQDDAFARMMKASKRREERQQALNHNLIDEQAEESDEDMGWGLTGGDEDDEEGNDEGYIQDLVDDQAIDEEQKKQQDELAAAKAREIAEADDAKREAEAKKITEGHYRTKRRGMDFFSDEEGDEVRGGKRRKLSKEERRALRKRRLLDREDGLEKLDGEENAFAQIYNADLESDEDSTVEDEIPERGATRSPTPETQNRSGKDKWDMLRQRARLNREHGENEDDFLDQEIGYTESGFRAVVEEEIPTDAEDESQFAITRGKARVSASFVDIESGYSLQTRRSADSYAKYVRDESQTTRRANGTAGVSVVQPSHGRSAPSLVSRSSASQIKRPPSRADSSSSGGSILQSRGSKFN